MASKNESRTPVGRGAVEKNSDNKSSSSPSSSSARPPSITSAANQLASRREAVLWNALRRSIFLDVEEQSIDSATIRTLTHHAWRESFLAEESERTSLYELAEDGT